MKKAALNFTVGMYFDLMNSVTTGLLTGHSTDSYSLGCLACIIRFNKRVYKRYGREGLGKSESVDSFYRSPSPDEQERAEFMQQLDFNAIDNDNSKKTNFFERKVISTDIEKDITTVDCEDNLFKMLTLNNR